MCIHSFSADCSNLNYEAAITHLLTLIFIGTDVFVTFDTGDLDGTVYQDVYIGPGELSFPLLHNYSEPGHYTMNVSVSNLVR